MGFILKFGEELILEVLIVHCKMLLSRARYKTLKIGILMLQLILSGRKVCCLSFKEGQCLQIYEN
jgi:hypothetical protein